MCSYRNAHPFMEILSKLGKCHIEVHSTSRLNCSIFEAESSLKWNKRTLLKFVHAQIKNIIYNIYTLRSMATNMHRTFFKSKESHHMQNYGCNYLSMHWCLLNPVCKRGPCYLYDDICCRMALFIRIIPGAGKSNSIGLGIAIWYSD